MVTYPDDYDPTMFDNHGKDLETRAPKLSDYDIQKLGPTMTIRLHGEYILPADSKNVDMVTTLVQALTKVKSVYVDGKRYRKIDDNEVVDPEVFISVDKVILRDKLEVNADTPIKDMVEAIIKEG
jgi:hypothetical protein|tara:strand:- start:814 stop:1188 length:375 start_codon:yes stop_codon:yes gene_type:complete